MNILIFLKHLTKVIDVIFKIFPSVSVLSVYVKISAIVFQLFFDIFFVKMNGTYSELLVIYDLGANIKDILFELLFE